MSSSESETPKSNPDPQQHPLKAQYPSSEQPTYKAPVPPVNEMGADWTQVANAIDNIAVINAQIRDTLLGTNEALTALKDELNTAEEIREGRRTPLAEKFMRPDMRRPGESGVTQGRPEVPDADIEPTSAYLQGRAASQQELEHQRSEDTQREVLRLQIQQRPEFQQRLEAYRTLGPAEQLQSLRQMGVVQRVGDEEGLRIGDMFRSTDEIRNALGTPEENRSADQLQLVSILNDQFKRRVTDEMEARAPRLVERLLDSVENAGIRQLRYGQLTMQDILRSTGTLAGNVVTSMRQAQVDQERYAQELQIWQQAAAEAQAAGTEPPPAPTEPTPGTAGRFAIQHPSIAGRLIGASGSFLGLSGIARAAPVIGQALAIGQIGAGIFGRAFGSLYQAPTRTGQLTGEGFRAGVGARLDAIRLGINPFDMISGQMAQQIVTATRERGFTGRQGDDVMEGIRDVVNDLGISIDQAADYFTDAMRRGGMSVDQVRKQMENFDDAAHDLNMNINEYTQAILQGTQSLRGLGAGTAAPALSHALIRALPAGFRDQAGQQFLTGLVQQNRGAIVARLNAQGIPANILTVTSQRYATKAFQASDDLIRQDMAVARQGWLASNPGKGEPTANDLANWMSQAGIYTRGTDPNLLENYIKRLEANRGIGNQLRVDQVQRNLEQRQNQLQRRAGRFPAYGSEVFRRNRGQEVFRNNFGQNIFDRGFGQEVFQGRQRDIPINQLVAARQQMIDRLPPGFLNSTDEKNLLGHLRDRSFNFQRALDSLASENRQIDPGKVQSGHVTIQLKDKATRDLFKLNIERRNAVQNGSLPSNQNPSRLYTGQ